MTLYAFLKLAHILGAIGSLALIALEAVALTRLRRAETASDVRTWIAVLSKPPLFGPIAFIVTIATGGWMMSTGWGAQPWIFATFAALGGMFVLGGAVSRRRVRRLGATLGTDSGSDASDAFLAIRRDRPLLVVNRLQIGIAVAIVALMSLKPGATGSALLLAACAVTGLLAGLLPPGNVAAPSTEPTGS